MNKQDIELIVNSLAIELDFFVVDITVSATKSIGVYVDNINGLAIDDCVKISRSIESKLDREKEDFDLTVSTPGIDQEFKHIIQYKKNIGREINAVLNSGEAISGILTDANDNEFEIETKKKVKIEGKKKKELVIDNFKINYTDVKSAKLHLSF